MLDSRADRMRHEVARIAERLVGVIASFTNATAHDMTVAGAAEFLRGMVASAPTVNVSAERRAIAVHPLDRLAHRLSLAPIEIDLALLAGMADEHEGFSSVFRSFHPRSEPRPTVALAAQLFCDGLNERPLMRDAIENGAAARAGLIRLGGDGPFYERNLILAEGLWPVLYGIEAWPPVLHVMEDDPIADGLEEWLDRRECTRALATLQQDTTALVTVSGDTERIAAHRALALARAAGRSAVHLTSDESSSSALGLAALHSIARGAVAIVELTFQHNSGPPPTLELPSFSHLTGPLVLCIRSGAVTIQSSQPTIALVAHRLSARSLTRMWRSVLPELASDASALATRYPLEPTVAARVAADVRNATAHDGRKPQIEHVGENVQARTTVTIGGGVKRVQPTASWMNLVLPPNRLAQLHEVLGRLQHQPKVLDEWGFLDRRPGARGVRVLFCGPPGTGKTLSAEVLANALGAELLVVDVSRVVSKWIGETEKNLGEVFDAAEHSPAVLLFDEADALFGRRTEVSDAHDRYANLETAYLLSRLERFEGLAILASNLKQNIDPAFLRRLEFLVEFAEPSVTEREALWRCHLPPNAPLARDVDLAGLAAFYPVVGATIRNAAVAAAFLAAGEELPIARAHVLRALQREYEKTGKAFPGVPPNGEASAVSAPPLGASRATAGGASSALVARAATYRG